MMPGILDKVKGGAEKASFEADRLRRVTRAQSELRTFQQQLATVTAALGRQALTLYDAGKLTQPELLATCRRELDSLRQQIMAQQAEIERIREEKPPEATPAPQYGHMCPHCRIQLPPEAGFCPRCGSQAMDVAQPQPAATVRCARCGVPMSAQALFCTCCGARAEEVAPKVNACPSCQAAVPSEAVFCPSCGASVNAPLAVTQEALRTEAEQDGGDGIVCPTCAMWLPDGTVVCHNCGTSLTMAAAAVEEDPAGSPASVGEAGRIVCPTCGTPLPAEAIFCPQCGEPMAAGSAA
jgi:predicted amidophosphoribosyltransferase